MRILHSVEAFGGGVFELVRMMAEGAARADHDVAIAYGVRPETPAEPRDHIDERVELFPTPWKRRTLRAQVLAARELRSLTRRWAPDVVHFHSSFAGVVGALALNGRAPTIYTPHAYASTMREQGRVKAAAIRTADRIASRRVDVLAVTSHGEAEVAGERLGVRSVELVLNGIPELDEGRAVTRQAPPARRVITIGRPVAQRRPEATVRILREVTDLAEVLWVGGGRPGTPETEAILGAGVPMTGWVPRTEVLRHLGEAAAYLHWSAWDATPLSLLEALAQDVVVVASDIGANRELLPEQQVCSTESEVVALLRRILDDEEFAATLRESQRERRVVYSAQRMVNDWLALYERVGSAT